MIYLRARIGGWRAAPDAISQHWVSFVSQVTEK